MDVLEYIEQMELIQGLQKKEVDAFIRLSSEYAEDLLVLAYTITNDPDASLKAVQMLFTALWKEEQPEDLAPPIHHYLYKELKRCCKTSDYDFFLH